MKLTVFSVAIFLVGFCLSAQNSQTPKPTLPGLLQRPNPFVILQIMPKVIEKIRERFPRQSIEVIFPAVLKEIQQTIQMPQFSGLSPDAMPALISGIIERVIQRLSSISQPSETAPSPGSGASPDQGANEREVQTEKPEPKVPEPVVLSPRSELPDLAFDRDPSRNNPNIRELQDYEEEDEELGSEPTAKQEKPPSSLGEYDQFYHE